MVLDNYTFNHLLNKLRNKEISPDEVREHIPRLSPGQAVQWYTKGGIPALYFEPYFDTILQNRPTTLGSEKAKQILEQISSTTVRLVRSREEYSRRAKSIMQRERGSWRILVDESGNCDDYLASYDEAPSAIIAVLVPPDTELPDTPFRFHASGSKNSTKADKLRKDILKHPEVIVLALIYRSGRPPANPDSRTSRDLHAQLWKNVFFLALEIIASRNATKNVRVFSYFEQVGPFTPELDDYFFSIVQDLCEKNGTRSGWNLLKIMPPRIVAKDTHPLMGYPDALGHVFRRRGDDCPDLFCQVIDRKNTMKLDYRQHDFEILYNILTLFARQPAEALRRIVNTPYTVIRQFREVADILNKPVRDAWDLVTIRQIEDICRAITGNISRRPECYRSCEFVLGPGAVVINEKLPGNVVKFEFYLNMLAVCNHRGDVARVEEIIEYLDSMSEDVSYEHQFRYATLKGDIYNNRFEFDAALKHIDRTYKKAVEQVGRVERALHVIGFRIMTLALMGRSQDALDMLERYASHAGTTADQERWSVYRANIFVDLEQYDQAETALGQCLELTGETVFDYTEKSTYFRQALMKTMAHGRPVGVGKDNLPELASLPLDTSRHPAVSIAYWSIIALERFGHSFDNMLPQLESALFETDTAAAPALRYIAYAFYLKALARGFVGRNTAFEKRCGDVAGQVGGCDDPLELLHFNYL